MEHEPEPLNTTRWIVAGLALAGIAVACFAAIVLYAVFQTVGMSTTPQLSKRAPFGPALPLTASEAEVQALPFAEVDPASAPSNPGKVYVARSTYPHGGYGVIDLGDLRFAVRGLEVSNDFDWTAIVLSESGKSTGRRSVKGRTLSEMASVGPRSIHRVHGFEFRLEAGTVTLESPTGSTSLPVRGKKRVIFVDRDGSNVDVRGYFE